MLADLTSLSKDLTTDVSQKPAWTLKRDNTSLVENFFGNIKG